MLFLLSTMRGGIWLPNENNVRNWRRVDIGPWANGGKLKARKERDTPRDNNRGLNRFLSSFRVLLFDFRI